MFSFSFLASLLMIILSVRKIKKTVKDGKTYSVLSVAILSVSIILLIISSVNDVFILIKLTQINNDHNLRPERYTIHNEILETYQLRVCDKQNSETACAFFKEQINKLVTAIYIDNLVIFNLDFIDNSIMIFNFIIPYLLICVTVLQVYEWLTMRTICLSQKFKTREEIFELITN